MDRKEFIKTLKDLEGHLESVRSAKAFANDKRLDEILSKAIGLVNDLDLEPIIEQPVEHDSREKAHKIVNAIEALYDAASHKIALPDADAELNKAKNSLQMLIENLNA